MCRDEFSADVKDLLAKRVAMRCSNPNCRQPTSGPHTDEGKALNVGVAAHITAAAEGGPRYDPHLSPEERSCFDNGIWLCQTHGKLVDNDPARYTVDLLREWKSLAEQAALLEVEGAAQAGAGSSSDTDLIRFYAQCFDREAFKVQFRDELSMEDFDQAVADTITALCTGSLRDREDRAVLAAGKGKSFLENALWRANLDAVVDMLRAIRSRFRIAVREGGIHLGGRYRDHQTYCIYDNEVATWMDETRAELLGVFATVCKEAGVTAPQFPRPFPRRGW